MVVGVGNVALDVARVLARTPAELEPTDMPQHVLDALAATPVEEVTVLGRRGPAQASFTTQELRELGELDGATVLVDAGRPRARPGSRGARRRRPQRQPATSRCSAAGPTTCAEPGRTRLHLRFFARPVRLLGEDRVTGVEVERTAVDAEGRAVGTGELDVLPADLVVRSVGYFGHAAARPAGRRARRHRAARRGPGAARREALSRRVRRRLDQARARAASSAPTSTTPGRPSPRCWPTPPTGVLAAAARSATWSRSSSRGGAEPVLIDDWRAIDAAEVALGATRGRARTTLHEREALLAAVRAAASR